MEKNIQVGTQNSEINTFILCLGGGGDLRAQLDFLEELCPRLHSPTQPLRTLQSVAPVICIIQPANPKIQPVISKAFEQCCLALGWEFLDVASLDDGSEYLEITKGSIMLIQDPTSIEFIRSNNRPSVTKNLRSNSTEPLHPMKSDEANWLFEDAAIAFNKTFCSDDKLNTYNVFFEGANPSSCHKVIKNCGGMGISIHLIRKDRHQSDMIDWVDDHSLTYFEICNTKATVNSICNLISLPNNQEILKYSESIFLTRLFKLRTQIKKEYPLDISHFRMGLVSKIILLLNDTNHQFPLTATISGRDFNYDYEKFLRILKSNLIVPYEKTLSTLILVDQFRGFILDQLHNDWKGKNHFKFWFANCGLGLEANLLCSILADLFQLIPNLTFDLYFTDIDERALEIAKFRSYSNKALEPYSGRLTENRFIVEKNSSTICPTPNANYFYLVTDAAFNNPEPDTFDIAVCLCSRFYNSVGLNNLYRNLRQSLTTDGRIFFLEQSNIDSEHPNLQLRPTKKNSRLAVKNLKESIEFEEPTNPLNYIS